ncbi:Methionyl-tRNA formyltransferase [Lachnospiraceae bacterium TWA4]|nr:Methionyl-tRNA formyltransferase [Lachnospiraceae bacterium TWA4]
MKIVYMGTPDFAVPALQAIAKVHQVELVITQPDKPKGRGKAMQFTPVKEAAVSLDIPVYQPEDINSEESYQKLKEISPDIMVVAAFGQILKERILNLPTYGCINIHASLLPNLRGAAPIQFAILEGHKKAGVTIMQMAKGLDSGDMISKSEVVLDAKETGGSLHDKLSALGGTLILDTLKQIEEKTATYTPQGEEFTYAGMLTKSMGEIDWNKDAITIERLIRGLNPWPSAYTFLENKMLKIWEAEIVDKKGKPGEIIEVTKKDFTVATGDGSLVIKNLQLQGKKRMDVDAFLRGVKLEAGIQLGRIN